MLINELVTKLSFKMDGGLGKYVKGLLDAKRQSEAAAKAAEDAHRGAAENMVKYYRDANGRLRDQNGRFVKDSENTANRVSASFKKISLNLTALAGGYAAVNAAQKAASFMFSATAEKETALTQLTTLVGKDKAGGIFKDLQKFAATTPYELKDVMEMFNRLEGAGFGMLDKAGRVQYDKLINLGDLASASNKPLSELTDTILSANRGLGSMVDNFVGLSAKAEDGALAVTMFDRATGKTTTKKVQSGDKAGIMDFFTQAAQRQGIKGGMGELSKTLTGQMSTLTDSAKNLATTFSAGFIEKVHKLLEGTIKQLDKMEPQFKSMGETAGKFINDMPKLFKEAQPYIEGCAAALAGMAFSYGVMKGLAVIQWLNNAVIAWRAMDAAMKIAAISGWAANAAVAWLPTMIAVAAAAVIWFGWQVYKYLTEGTDSLTWMNENFKWLADAIMLTGEVFKTWRPILEYIGKVLVGALIVAFNGLMTVIDIIYQYTFKPFVDFVIWGFGKIGSWIKSVTIDSDTWRSGVMTLWDGWKQFLNWLSPVLEWVSNTVGGIGSAIKTWTDALSNVPGFNGGDNSGNGSGLDPSGNLDISKDGKLSNNLAIISRRVKSLRKDGGDCLNVVWRIQQAALNGTSKITALHAADAAQQMAADKRFKEIKVTKAMLSDPRYKALLQGAQVFYDRESGFSPKSGHAESWDMSTGSAYFGRGAVPLSQRSEHMLKHARVFIPVQQAGAAGAAPITVNVNVGGSNASPNQIGDAAGRGTGKALTKAKQQQRKPVNPGRVGAVLG